MFEPDKKVLLQLSMNLIKSYCYIYSGPIVQEGVHWIFVVVILIITYILVPRALLTRGATRGSGQIHIPNWNLIG
jgi:hypothetical protein